MGFLLGLRHALDPDHVAAVSTMVSARGGIRRSLLVGPCWGLGHAAALLAAGGVILVLRLSLPPALELWAEGVVAAMLVVLGLGAVVRSIRDWHVHAHRHVHDGVEHLHFHAHRRGVAERHDHVHPLRAGIRPFLVGAVHGLAGTAGLSLLVLGAAPPSVAVGFAYLAALGLGALVGMLVLSTLLTLPLSLLNRRYAPLRHRVQLAAGIGSLALGAWLLAQAAV